MREKSETPPPSGSQFLVYQTEDGTLKIDVRFEGETVWLTQQHMAELFQTTKQNVSLHIQNIYEERELERGATVKESLTVQREGNRSVQRRVELYKVHWAITGQTAAEIVHGRVAAAKPNLGRTNWRGAVIRKPDVVVAKNYLAEPELAALNNLVEQYLVFAQGQAMRRVAMHMADWIKKLDAFLTLNERDILTHTGRISHEMAQAKPELEYDKFKALTAAQPSPVDADFDTAVKQLQKPAPKPRKKKQP